MRIVLGLTGLILGAWLGRKLAARGVTAENALKGRQLLAYGILLFVAIGAAIPYFANRLSALAWLPFGFVLIAEEAIGPLPVGMATFALGLIALLEWPGRREPRRVATALVGSSVLVLAVVYLVWRSQPVTPLLLDPVVRDGVVMQTTSYTCAPSTIATLARFTGIDTTMTERAVVANARTTREGTTTSREIKAMSALGMAPRFARFLSAESLLVIGRPALLHVDEPIGATTIRHAVALIGVDAARRTVTLGNPLYGRQVMRFDQLKGYWGGEAVFVMAGRAL